MQHGMKWSLFGILPEIKYLENYLIYRHELRNKILASARPTWFALRTECKIVKRSDASIGALNLEMNKIFLLVKPDIELWSGSSAQAALGIGVGGNGRTVHNA